MGNRHEYRFGQDQNLLSKIGQVEKFKPKFIGFEQGATLFVGLFFDQQKSLVYVYDLERVGAYGSSWKYDWKSWLSLKFWVVKVLVHLRIRRDLGLSEGQGICENLKTRMAWGDVKMFGHLLEEDFDPNDFDLELVQQN